MEEARLHALALPSEAPAGIEAFRLDLDLEAPWREADWAVLAEEERARAARFVRHEDRVRAVATRAALRRLLGERLASDPATLELGAGPYGKPTLAEGAGLDFNVSHSGAFALVALSRVGAVGVDIERLDEAADIAGLASLALSASERARGVDQAGFFELWVVKEAVLKALGVGVAAQLQAFSVLPRGAAYELRHDTEDWSTLRAFRLEAPPGYAAALALGPARSALASASGSTIGSEQVVPRQT
jgi:4'-phosphopantetheinyl transferase